MARWLVLAVLACGCRQIWGLGGTPEHAIDAEQQDSPPDVVFDAPTCFGSFGDAPYCFPAPPTNAFTVTSQMTIKTDDNSTCSTLFTTECVVGAATIEIDAKLSVIGSRPLVMISTGVLHVAPAGTIDAASHHNGNRGPAANDAACDNGMAPDTAGGGQGASFGGTGGDGGTATGQGGRAGGTTVPTTLRGGCQGANGGSAGGGGGNSGGAIYLIAGDEILISGFVDASGAGGNGASGNTRGGGGGGSGGMIVLESPTIVVDVGTVIANGGGGGGGAELGGGNGNPGDDPAGVTSAQGGQGGMASGGGGLGSGLAMPNGQAGFPGAGGGGGGGGGGAGVIKAIGGAIANILGVSPQPS